MKLEQQRKAKKMRLQGMSITTIAASLGVSKGSVSRWVRDTELSPELLAAIKKRSHSAAAVEARRASRLKRETSIKDGIRSSASSTITISTDQELKLIGIALYWGEGTKKKRGVVEFTNSDPDMIRIMMRFFKVVCSVPDQKFRVHVYLHSHLEPRKAEQYWSTITGIPINQFHKTSVQHNTNRIQKDTLPYGTCAIVICDTDLKLQIEGWTTGLSQQILNKK